MPGHWLPCLTIDSHAWPLRFTARKLRKYEVFPGSYFPVFLPEKTPSLDTFCAVILKGNVIALHSFVLAVYKKSHESIIYQKIGKRNLGRHCASTEKEYIIRTFIWNYSKKKLTPKFQIKLWRFKFRVILGPLCLQAN